MSVSRRRLRAGIRWSFDRTFRHVRLRSPWIYLTKEEAKAAEAAAVKTLAETGEIPPIGDNVTPQETVEDLYFRWLDWLKNHRSPAHHIKMRSLIGRALAQGDELADLPAEKLTIEHVETWAERWAEDLRQRGKGLQTINDWLRYSQTAWNYPWGRRRAVRQYVFNPFAHVDRYAISHPAKYVPTPAQVAAILLKAGHPWRLCLQVMIETGARVAEARNLAWQDVNCDQSPHYVDLYTQKTADGSRRPRRLSIPEPLAVAFRAWRRQQEGAVYVFQQEGAALPHGETWSLKQQRRACRLASVAHFPPGCYRHYRAMQWSQEGVPLTTIRDRLGHQKATTTDNYLRGLVGM